VRRKLALVLVLVLSGCCALFIPTRVLSEHIVSQKVYGKPSRRLLLLPHSYNIERASVSFRSNGYASKNQVNDGDLTYGSFHYNGDRDWFQVTSTIEDLSRIRDLGPMDWSDEITVPVLPILPCPLKDQIAEGCGRVQFPSRFSAKRIQDEDVNPHVAKPVAGHMYLVHTNDRREPRRPDPYKVEFFDPTDFYTLVRVEELIPNQSCTISWKRIQSPEKERRK
jgi:hypothetical protein